MTLNPKNHGDRMNMLLQLWSTLSPEKAYSGLTLEEVRAGFKASLDARARIAALQNELGAAKQERMAADIMSEKFYNRALHAIRAHPDEGEDGALYKALSYAKHASHRARKQHPVSPAPVLPPPLPTVTPSTNSSPPTVQAA